MTVARHARALFLAVVAWEGYTDTLRILATGQDSAEAEASRLVRSRELMPGGTLVSVTRAPRVTL